MDVTFEDRLEDKGQVAILVDGVEAGTIDVLEALHGAEHDLWVLALGGVPNFEHLYDTLEDAKAAALNDVDYTR